MVLLLAYILSFVDRNVLSLLVGPIRNDLGISDFRFSILHGWAFTLFYIGLGIPIGWLADRYSRQRIILLGVLFWSLMTCLCGFATSFWILFLARVGVGVGEATLSPSAYSLMSDYFPPRRLRWATSIFTMGITLGSGLSYLVGGWLYDRFEVLDRTALPWLADLHSWQLTFVAVGLPGLGVAALLLAVREPPRREELGSSRSQPMPVNQVVDWLRTHRRFYLGLFMAVSMLSIIGYGMLGWFPELLFRSHGMSRSQAGAALGLIFMVAGTAGSLSGALFSGWLQRLGHEDANLRLVMVVAGVLVLPATLLPLMPSPTLTLALAVPVIFLHYTHFGVAMAALQLASPNRMRAQVSALMLLLANLFGLALGGSIVAFLTDFVFGQDQALRYSLALVAALTYPAAAVLAGRALLPYRKLLTGKMGAMEEGVAESSISATVGARGP